MKRLLSVFILLTLLVSSFSSCESYETPEKETQNEKKQKYGNGYWIGLTMSVQPKCFSLYNFVPFLFVLALIGCSIFSIISVLPLILLLSLYFTAAILYGIKSLTYKSNRHFPYPLFPVFFLMHLFYGIGTLVGILTIPYFKHKNKEV